MAKKPELKTLEEWNNTYRANRLRENRGTEIDYLKYKKRQFKVLLLIAFLIIYFETFAILILIIKLMFFKGGI